MTTTIGVKREAPHALPAAQAPKWPRQEPCVGGSGLLSCYIHTAGTAAEFWRCEPAETHEAKKLTDVAWVESKPGSPWTLQLLNKSKLSYFISVFMDGIRVDCVTVLAGHSYILDHVRVSEQEEACLVWGNPTLQDAPADPSVPYNLQEQTKNLGTIIISVSNAKDVGPGPMTPIPFFRPKAVQAPEVPEKRDIIRGMHAIQAGERRVAANIESSGCYVADGQVGLYMLRYGPVERKSTRYTDKCTHVHLAQT